MKFSIILLSFYLFSFTNLFSQEIDSLIIANPIELKVEKRKLGNKEQKVFMIHVSEAVLEDVEKAWTNTLEKKNKAKMELVGGERIIKGITIEDIDKKALFNVYSQVTTGRNGINVYAAFQINDSIWIDPESDSGNTIRTEKVMMNFGQKIYTEVLNDKLVIESKKFKELEKSYDSKLEEHSDLRKNIQSDSLAIFNNKNEIELKKKEYSTVTDKLSKQRNEIASTNYSSEEAKKEANRKVKQIEKEQKQVTKTIEKLQDDTIDKEKNIADSFYKIENLKVEETEILKKVTEQKSRVDRLEHEIYSLEK